MTLCLAMIVKNEERHLARCLDSVKSVVDEIVIVDTGSIDKTVEIAKRYTDKVYHFEWIDDFAAARNYSFSQAESDYIIWLDADDVVPPESVTELSLLKQADFHRKSMIAAIYHISFDAEGKPTFGYYRERIFKRSQNVKWLGAVHEVIPLSRDVYYSKLAIEHRKIGKSETGRNLKLLRRQREVNGLADARLHFYYARELKDNGLNSLAVKEFEAYLARTDGWKENKIEACLALGDVYASLHMESSALASYARSFYFDAPRGEICCAIGSMMLSKNAYEQAIFWYDTATRLKPNLQSGAFVHVDAYGYIPYMQLCVCYDRLGDTEHAEKSNESAGKYKPKDPAYLHNLLYFHNLKK